MNAFAILLTLGSLFLLVNVHGQTSFSELRNSSIVSTEEYKYAQSLSSNNEYELSLEAFNRCLDKCILASDSVIVYGEIAHQKVLLGQPQEAAELLRTTLSIADSMNLAPQMKYALYHTSTKQFITLRIIGDYEGIIESSRRTEFFLSGLYQTSEEKSFLYKERGIAFWRMNRLDSSLIAIEKSISIGKMSPKSQRIKSLLAQNNIMLGLIYWKENAHLRALEYYKIALIYYRNLHERNDRGLFITCNNIGILYQDIAEYDSTIAYLSLAKTHLEQMSLEGATSDYTNYYNYLIDNNLALAHIYIDDLNRAEKLSQRSYELCLKVGGEDHPDLIPIMNTKVEVLLAKGHAKSAYQLAQRSLAIAKSSLGFCNSRTIEQYNKVAKTSLSLRDFNRALIYADSSLQCNRQTPMAENIVHMDTDEFYQSIEIKLNILKENDFFNEQLIESLFKLFKENYSYVLFHHDDEHLRETIHEILDGFFQLYYSLYIENCNISTVQNLIEIIEIKKSRKLLRHILMRNGILNNIPKSYQLQEKELRDSISTFLFDDALSMTNKDSMLSQLRTRHADLLDKLPYVSTAIGQNLLSKIKFDILECQLSMRDEEIKIFFFQSKEILYAINLYNGKQEVVEYKIADIHQLFSMSRTDNKLRSIQQSFWSKLEIPDNIRHLEILPDGIAWKINFESLPDFSLTNNDYLGMSRSIIYQYSYSYQSSSRENSKGKITSVIGLSYPKSVSNFATLSGSIKEMDYLKELWGSKFHLVKPNKNQFREIAKEESIIHIALHSVSDTIDPNNSRILFDTKVRSHSGSLNSYEVTNLQLNSELVVLSSCETGKGKTDNSEGILSIARAFTIAGSRSVFASRENVIDASTPIIIRAFYQNLQRGYRKSEALRLARKTYLQDYSDNVTSHPKFWSHFYLIGDDSPLNVESNIKSWPYMTYFILFITVFSFYNYMSRHHSNFNSSIIL